MINSGKSPEELLNLLRYATENCAFYAELEGKSDIADFPVMNKTLLNANYDKIAVPSYNGRKTHKMYTSGSTGIPFMVA